MSRETSDQMSTADLVDLHGEALQSIPLQLRELWVGVLASQVER